MQLGRGPSLCPAPVGARPPLRAGQPPCVPRPQGKKLPAGIGADVEEGDVSDEDSAEELEADCKLPDGDVSRGASCRVGPGPQGQAHGLHVLFCLRPAVQGG